MHTKIPVYVGSFLLGVVVCGSLLLTKSLFSASQPAWVDHPNGSKLQQPTVLAKHQLFSEDHTSDIVAIGQVWSAYVFYNDTMNGAGVASLFTPDGVDQHLWVTPDGKFVPHFGVVDPKDVGKNMTPQGPLGSGCILRGRDQIAYYFGPKRASGPIGWPAHFHHETPSMAVKVSDDGQTAVLSAPAVLVGVNDKGEGRVGSGGYQVFFKKTSEGWEIAEEYSLNDSPVVSPGCDLSGPTGMHQ
jgi:hypothetical protein